jgi:hypothetical protein
VPEWEAQTPFAAGIGDALRAFDAHPEWQTIDDEANSMFDRLGAIYRGALRSAGTD